MHFFMWRYLKIMKKKEQERAKTLIQATIDILTKVHNASYVYNVLDEEAVWDGEKRDGYCLKKELEKLMKEIDDNAT